MNIMIRSKKRYIKREEKDAGRISGLNLAGSSVRMAIVAVLFCMLLLPGCSDDAAVKEAEQASEQTLETADARIEVILTGNYSYSLPADAEEATSSEKTEDYKNECFYRIKDGAVVVRSFYMKGEELFPGYVEYLFENKDVKPGYSNFYDTAIAKAEDTIDDGQGNELYRVSYFWPDGGGTLCSLSFMAYSKEELDVAKTIMKSVKNKSNSNVQDGDAPVGAEEFLTPSQEEIDQMLIEDAQQSTQEYDNDSFVKDPGVLKGW